MKTSKPLLVIPGCFLGGAVFCLFCDLIARTAFAPTELSISSVTAVFGAPVVIYTYYFGNRIEQGKVKLLSQEGRNAVLLVEYNDHRSWSAKFNATMLTDTSFFLTRQKPEDYYLEDSIVMTKYYPEKERAEVRKIIEEYNQKERIRYEALKKKGIYLK